MHKNLYKPYYEEKPFGDPYIVSWDRRDSLTGIYLRIVAHYKEYPGDEGENVDEYEPWFDNGYPPLERYKTFDEAHKRLMKKYREVYGE